MADLIGKVAKAIDPPAFEEPGPGWFAMQPKGQSRETAIREWESRKYGPRAKARIRARAAIRALIEPTPGMYLSDRSRTVLQEALDE